MIIGKLINAIHLFGFFLPLFIPLFFSIGLKNFFKPVLKLLLLMYVLVPMHWIFCDNKCFLTYFTKQMGEYKNNKSKHEFIETNLTSIFHIITMCRKNLIKSEKPSIVNIASIHALTFPDWNLYKNTKVNNLISYSVSKGGLVNMSKWLATYLAPKIRVNTVSPGGIKKKQDQKFIKKYIHKNILKE